MPENAEPPPGLSTKEARRLQKKYQEKKKRMASHWFAWLEFEKYLSADTMYSRTVYKMVARISQTIALAKNVDNQTIRWDEARDRVLTLDVLQGLEKTYEKSFRTLHHDIAAVASHASWLSGVYRRGDGRILAEILDELRGPGPQIVIAEPQTPVQRTAAEIVKDVRDANARFQEIQREFLGDPTSPAIGRTKTFNFLDQVNIDRSKKKPRRNYRREIGL